MSLDRLERLIIEALLQAGDPDPSLRMGATQPNERWHADLSYLRVEDTWYVLVTVLRSGEAYGIDGGERDEEDHENDGRHSVVAEVLREREREEEEEGRGLDQPGRLEEGHAQ